MSLADRYPELLAQAIQLAKQGQTPTDALLHVAEAHDLPAHAVSFLAGQMNTSRSLVHMVKTAGAERIGSFELADPRRVIEIRGKNLLAKQTPAVSVPVPTAATVDSARTAVRKQAAAEADVEPIPSLQQLIEEDTEVVGLEEQLDRDRSTMRAVYHTSAADARRQLLREIGEFGHMVRKMASSERARLARRMVNRFGQLGTDMVQQVWHQAGIEEAVPARTGEATIFPPEPAYLKVDAILKKAQDASVFESNAALMGPSNQGDLLETIQPYMIGSALGVGTAPALLANQVRTGEQLLGADRESRAGLKQVSMGTRAQLQALRLRKTFMDAILNDPQMRGYPLRRLVRAFNDSVQNEPSLTQRPSALRASMQQMLASGSLDPFTLKTFSDLAVNIGKNEQQRLSKEKSRQTAFDRIKLQRADQLNKLKETEATVRAARQEAWQEAGKERKDRWDRSTARIVGGWEDLKQSFRLNRDLDRSIREADPEALNAAMRETGLTSMSQLRKALKDSIQGKEPEGVILGRVRDRGKRFTETYGGIGRDIRATRDTMEQDREQQDRRVRETDLVGQVFDRMAPDRQRAVLEGLGAGSREEALSRLVDSRLGIGPKGSVLGQQLDANTLGAQAVTRLQDEIDAEATKFDKDVRTARRTAEEQQQQAAEQQQAADRQLSARQRAAELTAEGLRPSGMDKDLFLQAADELMADPRMAAKVGGRNLQELAANATEFGTRQQRLDARAGMQIAANAAADLAVNLEALRADALDRGLPKTTQQRLAKALAADTRRLAFGIPMRQSDIRVYNQHAIRRDIDLLEDLVKAYHGQTGAAGLPGGPSSEDLFRASVLRAVAPEAAAKEIAAALDATQFSDVQAALAALDPASGVKGLPSAPLVDSRRAIKAYGEQLATNPRLRLAFNRVG